MSTPADQARAERHIIEGLGKPATPLPPIPPMTEHEVAARAELDRIALQCSDPATARALLLSPVCLSAWTRLVEARDAAVKLSNLSKALLEDCERECRAMEPRFSTAWEREDYERQKRGQPPLGPPASPAAKVKHD